MAANYDVGFGARNAERAASRLSTMFGFAASGESERLQSRIAQEQLAAKQVALLGPSTVHLLACKRLMQVYLSKSSRVGSKVMLARPLLEKDAHIVAHFNGQYQAHPLMQGGRPVILAQDCCGFICACCFNQVKLEERILTEANLFDNQEGLLPIKSLILRCVRRPEDCDQVECKCLKNINVVTRNHLFIATECSMDIETSSKRLKYS